MVRGWPSGPGNLVDQIFNEHLLRDRKEKQLAPQALYRPGAGQASAGRITPSRDPVLLFRVLSSNIQQQVLDVLERKKLHVLRALEEGKNIFHGPIPMDFFHPLRDNLPPACCSQFWA